MTSYYTNTTPTLYTNYSTAGTGDDWANDYLFKPMNNQTLYNLNNSAVNYVRSKYSTATTDSVFYTDVTADSGTCSVKFSNTWDNYGDYNCTAKYTTFGGDYGVLPSYNWYKNHDNWYSTTGISAEELARREKQEKLRHNMVILVKSRAEDFALKNAPQNELLAIETLREMISEEAFKRYIKYGFINVQGSDGCMYQIFRNKSHTKVWRGGKVIEEICVRIKSEISAPATDNVIAFKTMIESNAEAFKKLGNVYKMNNGSLQRVAA